MRLTGALFIVLSAFYAGLLYNSGLRNRILLTGAFAECLKNLKREMQGNSFSLPEAISASAAGSSEICMSFFQCVSKRMTCDVDNLLEEIWAEETENLLSDLSAEAKHAVCSMGKTLGRYKLPEQLSELQRCIELLEADMRHAEEKYKNLYKINIAVPAAAAMLVVTLLF